MRLTREMLVEAMEPTPSENELGHCIVVLHPGDEMYSPKSKPTKQYVIPNHTGSDVAYRVSCGMGWWVGPPVSTNKIKHDDAPTVCSHGVRVHNPATPEDVLKRREAEEAAARKAADRQKAAEDWAHARVEEVFNSGLAMSREDMLSRYQPVFDGLTGQWLNDNPEKTET